MKSGKSNARAGSITPNGQGFVNGCSIAASVQKRHRDGDGRPCRVHRTLMSDARAQALELALAYAWHNARTPHFDFDLWRSLVELALGQPRPGAVSSMEMEEMIERLRHALGR